MSCIIALKSLACPVPSCSFLGLAGCGFTFLVVTMLVTMIPEGKLFLEGRDLRDAAWELARFGLMVACS